MLSIILKNKVKCLIVDKITPAHEDLDKQDKVM